MSDARRGIEVITGTTRRRHGIWPKKPGTIEEAPTAGVSVSGGCDENDGESFLLATAGKEPKGRIVATDWNVRVAAKHMGSAVLRSGFMMRHL